ncbi:juvenile hormone esterase-like isoform X2 [Thrips palmi]|uniref:Carboxylic ester hydrolase n=1 Tax=Thrips palmi TaxID=161013 RepID=A0A6P8ZAA4_THRPL|nr:juvenile hormone esterase-like isoform X2 [Thrips palmi]
MWTEPARSSAVGPDSPDGDLDDGARPLVRIETGALRGRRKRTAKGAVYFSFRGIPYATPPLGDLRFRAPRPAQPWSGVRDAGSFGPQAMQSLMIIPLGPRSWTPGGVAAHAKTVPALLRAGWRGLRAKEDCLYANVYTPQLPRLASHPGLPVLVFIHGGGFRHSDGSDTLLGPEYVMEAGGIVLVTFNYRLGPFGFLAVGTAEAPGNAGLKDQALLLHWLRDNIASFGGDPGNVTLAGESAGGVAAHLHCLSPLSRGLFHRVIASSSLASSDWAMEEQPLQHARALAKALGVAERDLADPDALVRRLRAVPASALQRQFQRMHPIFTPRLTLGMLFVPVVEPALDGAFLAEDPVTVLAEGRQADVALMTGSNDMEGLVIFLGIGDGVFGPKGKARERAFMEECMRHSPARLLPVDLHRALDGRERAALAGDVLQHYFGDGGLGAGKFHQFMELFGDTLFVLPVLRDSRLHAATGTAPVYHYFFNHDGQLNLFKQMMKLTSYRGHNALYSDSGIRRSVSLAPARGAP